MSYTVLARRYRSVTFDEVIGQAHVAQTLKKAIAAGRVAHAYLFCGTRGTGKTSMARIFAKALNCERFDAATTTPCGQCNSCQAIARGDDIDVIEIDAASNTGVDNVRDIIMNAGLGTARSRFKVYIIDEVHMLSKSAFNALLKTLEEPPSHVKFILATTEAERILPTILSRCQRYDFRNIPAREVAGHLRAICAKENIKADDDALLLVAKAGAGSMRDALSLLDRLLSVGERELTVEMIEQLLGLPRTQVLFDLAGAVGSGDVKAVLSQTEAIISAGMSPDTLVASLTDHLRNLLILNTCGKASGLVDVPGLALDDLDAQARKFDPVALAQDIAILEELRRSMRQSGAGRALLDATLVRVALSEQFTRIADLLAGGGSPGPWSDGASRGAPEKKKPAEPMIASPAPPRERAGNSSTPIGKGAASASARTVPDDETLGADGDAPPSNSGRSDTQPVVERETDDLPAVGKVWEPTGPTRNPLLKPRTAPAPVPPRAQPPIANVEPVDTSDMAEVRRVLLTMLAPSPGVHGVLCQGQFVGVEDGRVVIRFPTHAKMLVGTLDRNGKKEAIAGALSKIYRSPIGLRFEISDENFTAPMPAQPTPQGATLPPRRPTPENVQPPVAQEPPPGVKLTTELREQLLADPYVRSIIDALGGEIVKVE